MAINGLRAALAATIALGAASAAQAAGTPLSIQSGVDSNLYTYDHGTIYPPAGSTVSISGVDGSVDFTLANFFPATFMAPDVGVVQADDGHPDSIAIAMPAVTVGRSTVFYSIINSAFGQATNTIGNLTLTFRGGASFAYALTEGDNVRDHFNGVFNNVAPNVYGTVNYSSADGSVDRFDAQQIALPVSFDGDVLESITLNNTDPAGGNPFLAAFTVVDPAGIGAVPEPGVWAMMLMGFGGLGVALRARRRGAVIA